MKKIFTILFFAATAAAAHAQGVGVIRVEQSPLISELLHKHIAHNLRQPKIDGYRIRIYRDNSSNARARSEATTTAFTEQFPEIPAYRGYDNPYFKVSVGDFRNKDEAMRFFLHIKRSYPNAYIVAEEINLPPL